MNLKNKVQLIGHLGNDPEVFTFENGKSKARFSLATSESYRNREGERVTDTTWHNVIVWGKLADIAQKFLAKGSEVGIDGKLTYRSYEDKTNQKRFITEIVASELMLMGANKK